MREISKVRGVFEKLPGSGVWWIRYADSMGKAHREKAGAKNVAIALYQKRKTGILLGEKLPEKLRRKKISFDDLAKDALDWSKAHKITHKDDEIRMKPLKDEFGARAAESITPQDIEKIIQGKKWKPATCNRYKALVSMIYRVGINNGKVSVNPAKRVKTRTENNARTRYLSKVEEAKLRQTIADLYPERLPEFDTALHTGMRRSEQYGLTWEFVDLEKKILTIPRSKHGGVRYIYLNDTALAALQLVWKFSDGKGMVFKNGYTSDTTYGPRQWFSKCLTAAKIKDFTWHSLRHTFASNLVMCGVDIKTVQDLLGHKTIQMTLRYSHLSPQHQLEAVQRLCDTKPAQKEPTDTKTDTSDSKQVQTVSVTTQ